LQQELKYVEETLGYGAGSTSELVIQTPSDEGGLSSVLSPESLLAHMEIIRNASKVVVERDDVAWELQDLCYAPTIPVSGINMIDQIMENLFPCAVITPLDCFWEGSKLLGTDAHVPLPGGEGNMHLSWTTLNPNQLLQHFRKFEEYFNFQSFEEFMKRAGIDSGYQEKPCLNPHDPDCPRFAPNKISRQDPDIGAELTGGCYGFASRYMHWPEELIVGGTTKNKTGHIVRAKGLQSIVQLMGEKDLYDFHSDTYKVHSLDWSRETAAGILREWQDKFSQEVNQLVRENPRRSQKFKINAFSNSHMDAILQEFSDFSLNKVLIGCGFMVVYAAVTMFRWSDLVRSQSGLGVAGVLLVVLTIGPGLGLCALLGIHFNASTSHVVPYLALGLGVDAMFILAYTYAEQWHSNIPNENRIGEVLKRAGVSVFLTAACNIAAFLAAAVIPIPALRAFALQAAILIAFNLLSMLLIYPAFMAIDLRRVASKKLDILCCYSGGQKAENEANNVTIVEGKSAARGSTASLDSGRSSRHLVDEAAAAAHSRSTSTPPPAYSTVMGGAEADEQDQSSDEQVSSATPKYTLSWFAQKHYAPFIAKAPVKVLVVLACISLTGAGLWGFVKVKDGLDLAEVVPRNTSVHDFLSAQKKYFGFYHMHAVTQGNFEYPQNQALIYDYQNAFVRVPKVIKNDDGGLPEFWLSLFRNWLVKLQSAFDDDFADGLIWEGGWDDENASVDGIFAYKLLVQTGHVDYPVDETLLLRNRLVDAHGMINRNAFYNYLSAWYSNDAMAYSYSQANIVPTPKEWYHDSTDKNYLIPKSLPIVYAQIPFYLNNLADTEDMVDMIKQVRTVCQKFEDRGLPNFPAGVPFTFWEQYLGLRFWLYVAIGAILAAVFLAVSVVFMSPWLAAVVCVAVASIAVQLFGFMGILGIHLSAIPAVILIVAVGLGVEFVLHICIGFVTSIGSKKQRVSMALKHMFAPVVHGAFSTFLSVLMLEFSQFDFIVRYFFYVLTALIVLGVFNGLVFLPVLLLMIGPPAEVIPKDGGSRIEPPTPQPSPATVRHHRQAMDYHRQSAHSSSSSSRGSSSSRKSRNHLSIPVAAPSLAARRPTHHNSDVSLSTIAEESSYASQNSHGGSSSYCCKSDYPAAYQQQQLQQQPLANNPGAASVFVEPHVVVETTTYPASPVGNLHGSNGSLSRSSTPNHQGQVTKVTATAKFKVEVHSNGQQQTGGASGSPSSSLELPTSSRSGRRSSRSKSQGHHSSKEGSGLRVNLPPPSPHPSQSGAAAQLHQGASSYTPPMPPPPHQLHPQPSSVHSSLSESLRSSLSNSVSSSLSSDGGFSEK